MKYFCSKDDSSPASTIKHRTNTNISPKKAQTPQTTKGPFYCNQASYSKYYHTDKNCIYLQYAKDNDILTFPTLATTTSKGYKTLCYECAKKKTSK